MRKKRMTGKATALFFAGMLFATPCVYAEDVMQEFTLDPVSVTASRMEKKDLDIPASVRVYTAKDLENTGANNVIEAIKFSEGIIYASQAPGGQSISTMTSRVVVRGMEKGTLIMVNGVPMNLRGSFSLEDIPLGAVERIEVVKGNGSVMYGSEASGGVINIITKKELSKTVDLAVGNQERKRVGLSWQEGKLGINYTHNRFGNIMKYSKSTYWANLDFSHKDSLFLTYQFDDKWSVNHMSTKNHYRRWMDKVSDGSLYADNEYNAYQRRTYLHYDDGTLSGSIYDNRRSIYNKFLTGSRSPSVSKDGTIGLELQNRFDLSKGNIMAGLSAQRESYDNGSRTLDRMNYSLFAQWHVPFDNKWEMDLGTRLTWNAGAPGDNNYENISPQVQFLYKANSDTSFYSNVGRSFIMPTFSQLFGTAGNVVGNLDLEPQTGWQYEIGVKHNRGVHAWRVAIFYMDIKNNITAETKDHTNVTYSNEDFRNVGIEVSRDTKLGNGFNFTTGLVLSKPQIKGTHGWKDKYGRYQINFGIGYNKDKWSANFMGNFIGDRTAGSAKETEKIKPLFLTSLRIAYKAAKNHEIYFNMDNVLDRHASQTYSSAGSYYYQTPRNFEIGYRFSF